MSKQFWWDRFDHVEPAQPAVFKLHESLIRIYQLIRENFQADIDTVFDGVSEKIGMVITTSLPFEMKVEGNKIAAVNAVIANNEKASLYHVELKKIFEKMKGKEIAGVRNGSYELYAFWYDALRMKLKTSWMEPVHFVERLEKQSLKKINKFSWMEPVHWFDPRMDLALDEKIVISAIDEVFPDLKMEERIFSIRKELYKNMTGVFEPVHRPVVPGVREPAHYKDMMKERELPAYLKEFYESREPVHFHETPDIVKHPDADKILTEIATVLRKYGF